MKNFAIAFCIMVGFLIGAWFFGNREIPEARFMVTCAIFLCIWNLIEVHELEKLAKKFAGDQRPASSVPLLPVVKHEEKPTQLFS